MNIYAHSGEHRSGRCGSFRGLGDNVVRFFDALDNTVPSGIHVSGQLATSIDRVSAFGNFRGEPRPNDFLWPWDSQRADRKGGLHARFHVVWFTAVERVGLAQAKA